LADHGDALIKVAEALLERENLDGAEIRRMVFGEPPADVSPAGGETVAPADGPCLEEGATTPGV